jgi:hypothetical protein
MGMLLLVASSCDEGRDDVSTASAGSGSGKADCTNPEKCDPVDGEELLLLEPYPVIENSQRFPDRRVPDREDQPQMGQVAYAMTAVSSIIDPNPEHPDGTWTIREEGAKVESRIMGRRQGSTAGFGWLDFEGLSDTETDGRHYFEWKDEFGLGNGVEPSSVEITFASFSMGTGTWAAVIALGPDVTEHDVFDWGVGNVSPPASCEATEGLLPCVLIGASANEMPPIEGGKIRWRLDVPPGTNGLYVVHQSGPSDDGQNATTIGIERVQIWGVEEL